MYRKLVLATALAASVASPAMAECYGVNTMNGVQMHCDPGDIAPLPGMKTPNQVAADSAYWMSAIAQKKQAQAAINAYREAHGLPACTMFPLQHLFGGTPSC